MTKSQNTPKPRTKKMTERDLLLAEITSLKHQLSSTLDEHEALHQVIALRDETIRQYQSDIESISEILEEKKAYAQMLEMQLEMAEAKSEQLQVQLDDAVAEEITPEEYDSINGPNVAAAVFKRLNQSALEEKTMPNNSKPTGTNPFIEQAQAAKAAARIKMEGKAIHAGIHATERVLTQLSKDTVKMHEAHCDLQAQMTPEERMHTVDKRHELLSTVVKETMPMLKQFAEFLAWKAMKDEE